MSDRLTPRVTYTVTSANVGKKRFDFVFKIYDENDLKVVLSDGTTPSGYSVYISKNSDGGYITLSHDLAIGTKITLYRHMSFVRQTKFNENMDFRASVINKEFDRMVMLLQQVGRLNKDALRIPLSDTTMDMVLPNASTRANKVLAFDTHGKVQVRQDISESITIAKQHATEAKNAQVITDRNKRIVEQKVQQMDLTLYAKKATLGSASSKDISDFVISSDIGNTQNKIPKTDADFKTKTRRAVGNAVLKTSGGFSDIDGNTVNTGTYSIKKLWGDGYFYAGKITLNDSIKNYDALIFTVSRYYHNQTYHNISHVLVFNSQNQLPYKDWKQGIRLENDGISVNIRSASNTQIEAVASYYCCVVNVHGIKFK